MTGRRTEDASFTGIKTVFDFNRESRDYKSRLLYFKIALYKFIRIKEAFWCFAFCIVTYATIQKSAICILYCYLLKNDNL